MRVRERGRRALSFLLALVLALSLLPASALAAETAVATIGNTNYSSLQDAWKAAQDGDTITLNEDCTISSRLKLEDKKSLTIVMNGHKIDRQRTSYTSDGEVIWIGERASLTLKGGTNKETIHYTGWDASGDRQEGMTIKTGGLITGGWSSNGAGGIHMKYASSLTLDNVAVAGNRAHRTWSSDGYGGGIMLDGYNIQVIMKNGAAVNCNKAAYGGGIYVSGENATITMSGASEINGNYAQTDGGGLYSDRALTTLKMTDKSKMDSNSAKEGGGIYFNSSYFSVKSTDASASISWNKARDGDGGAICVAARRGSANKGVIYGITCDSNSASYLGGALYIHQENVVTSGCKLTNNSAEWGGGFYNDNDDNTISDTTITNNYADSDGAGGGVYSSAYNDIALSGKVIIKDNKGEKGENDDLYLRSMELTSYLVGAPSGQSEIGIRTDNLKERALSDNQEIYYENAFFSNNEGWHIEFDAASEKLMLKKGSKTTTLPDTINAPSAGEDSTKSSVHGKPVIRGYFSYPSVVESTLDLDSVFYYSDGYFLNQPEDYNEHLATMSMTMAMAAFYSNIGNSGKDNQDKKIPSERTYTYKSQNIKKLLTDIGVDSENVYISDSNTVKPGTGTIGVAIGQKTIQDGDTTYTLVPIAVRGAGYESEWYSNTTVGESGEHEGFASAADQVFKQVQSYISNYNLADAVSQGKVKFWIAGYSRAGATSNLTAKRLIEAYCYNKDENQTATGNQVYAYCFEAPKGGMNSAMTLSADKYYGIHNCINKADAVPLVAPEEMGFIRYGVDHYVPGDPTTTSTPSVNNKVWSYVSGQSWAKDYKTWYDNSSYTVGSDAYKTKREQMLKQLKLVDPTNIYFYDNFQMADVEYILGGVGIMDMISAIDTKDSLTQEEFAQLLVRTLQSWGFYRSYEADFRTGYTEKFDKAVSFEQALQTVTKIFFNKSSADLNGMMEAASGALDRIGLSDMLDIWNDMIGDWTSLSQSKRDSYLQFLWNVVMEQKSAMDEKTAAEYLTDSEKAELRSVWDVLMDVMLRFVEVDYNTIATKWNESKTPVKNPDTGKPAITPVLDGITNKRDFYVPVWASTEETQCSQVILGTLAKNATSLMQAHYPEINFAWLRSYDDFYEDTDGKEPLKIKVKETPVVTNTISGGTVNSQGEYEGDCTLTLRTNEQKYTENATPGAGIYYRLKTDTTNYGDWLPYNQPINLSSKNKSNTSAGVTYKVQTTAVYCGNTSEVTETTYTVKPEQTYFVHVNGESLGEFKAGDVVTIDGTPTGNDAETKMFKGWQTPTITGSESTINLDDASSIVTTFTMPHLTNGNSVVSINADYYTRISNVKLEVEKPKAGQPLNMTGTLSWTIKENGEDQTKTKDVSVAWVKKVGNGGQPVFRAEYGETYYPVVGVDQNLDEKYGPILVFKSGLNKTNVTITYTDNTTTDPESTKAADAYVNAEGMLVIYGSEVTTGKAKVESVPAYTVSILKDSVKTTEELEARLPQKVTVSTQDGDKTLNLSYAENAFDNVNLNNEGQYTVTATINYGEDLIVDSDEFKTTTVLIKVYANGDVAAPTADQNPGNYTSGSLTVHLTSTTEGATIKYKLGDSDKEETYDNSGITLTCDEGQTKTVTITAWATKSGSNSSTEVTYTYTLTNPLPTYTVTIEGRDTGTKQTAGDLWTKTYTYTKGETVTIGAPEEEDEVFEKWEVAENSGITIDSGNEKSAKLPETEITGNITLTAVYNPVVKQLDVEMVAPAIGTKLAKNITKAMATVTKENEVTPLFKEIRWTPELTESETPSYNTAYTAKLTLNKKLLTDQSIKFFLSENMTLNVPGASTATVVKEADGSYAVYVTFPKTEKVALKSVEQPDDVYVQHGATYALPTQATLQLVDGSTTTGTITWSKQGTFDASNPNAQTLTAVGTVTIPEDVQQGNVSNEVQAKVIMNAAPQVNAPTASLSSGSYTGEQVVRLNCDTDGATIYYTLDGSDPSTSSTEYKGGVITLDNTTKVTELHAIAVKEGLRNSTMAIYRYDVTRKSSSGGSSKPDKPADQPTTGGSDYKSCKHDSTCPLTKFTDLDATAWYHDGVHYCLDSGLMAGYGDALFGPNDKLSRAQVVTVLWRMAKSPAPTAENSFTDVPADTWYTDAVRWAAENGVVGGYGDGRFGPNDPVTREQMAAMFYRFAKQQGQDVSQSADLGTYADAASVSDWAKEALQWACGAGLINGMDGSLVPQGTATRAQTAAVLQRLSTLTK